MRTTLAIAWREFGAFFRLPVGWVVIALFVFLTGAVFAASALIPGEPASMRSFFQIAASLMIVIAPAVSMRLLSEEHRTGTLEPLMTSPVGDFEVVAGKYFGACLFLVAMLIPSLAYALVLWLVSDPPPDPGPVAAGYLSLLLVGMLYLAVGTAASAMTSSQTLAFLGTLLLLLILMLTTGRLAPEAPPPFDRALLALSINHRVGDFARGVIDPAHVVFFLSGSLLFVVFAYVALESRRWR